MTSELCLPLLAYNSHVPGFLDLAMVRFGQKKYSDQG